MENRELLWHIEQQSERLEELCTDDPDLKELPLRRDVRSLGQLSHLEPLDPSLDAQLPARPRLDCGVRLRPTEVIEDRQREQRPNETR